MFRRIDGTADIVVAEDITGTDDHENGRPIGGCDGLPISKTASGCKREPFRQGGIPFVFFVMLHFGYNWRRPVPSGRDYSERGY